MKYLIMSLYLILFSHVGLAETPGEEQQPPNAAIFVSFSMPELLLKQTIEQASKMKIPVVLRGLVENSFRKTAQKLFELSKETNTGGVIINPLWFKALRIEQVPSFLWEGKLVSGSLSLESALEHLKAGDSGKFGTTFPVEEEDFLEHIEATLNKKMESGEWTSFQKDFVERASLQARRPQGVKLPLAQASTSRDYDPSIVVEENIVDEKGGIMIQAGTAVNPLHTIALSSTLIFIDGDDPQQLEWLIKHQSDYSKPKVILVSGDIRMAQKALNQRVYFDQFAALTQKFSLQALPSVVLQKKDSHGALLLLLVIEEILVEEHHG